jgi:predicted RNA-binding protein YlxR (DUF448 family)
MKHQPERTCIGCRTTMNKDEVVRLIAGPEGILIDYREKLPGRAAYVCPRQDCVEKAFTRDTLAKAFRHKIQPPDLASFIMHLQTIIREKIKSLLAISLKTGKIAIGYSAVQDALEKGRVFFLLYACDVSEGTRKKVAVHGDALPRQATLFVRSELGQILQRELVGVVAILDQGLADSLWGEIMRLKNLINSCK